MRGRIVSTTSAFRMSMSLLLLLAGFHLDHVAGYLQGMEAQYLANFGTMQSRSYSAVDDASVAPSILHSCRNVGQTFPHDATRTMVNPENISTGVVGSASASQQCGSRTICVIGNGVTLQINDHLNVGALIVRDGGRVEWTDRTANGQELVLCAGYVAVEEAGELIIHLQEPQNKAWIFLQDNGATHPELRTRALGALGKARVEITGRRMERTWSLLAQPLTTGSNRLALMHDPVKMGWQIGDRISVAPTTDLAQGEGQTFRIVNFEPQGTVVLDAVAHDTFQAQVVLGPTTHSRQGQQPPLALMSAEVSNLSRNVIITGDDFRHIPCDPSIQDEAVLGEQTSTQGCRCSEFRQHCTVGLHTVHMYPGGITRIQNTRIEKCGQRGIEGKYCLHFHRMQSCPDCLYQNNVVENGQQRGIIVHDTHLSTVESNVIYNVRGAGIYIEDGNEMWNKIQYNVVVCPWKWLDPIMKGCTVPGTSNREGDTELNQSGIYSLSATNDLVGNRVSNSFNGMFIEAGGFGRNGAFGRKEALVCTSQTQFGRMEGNTFHSHGRFGFYANGNNYPKRTDRSLSTNGFNVDSDLCGGFYDDGEYNDDRAFDRGLPVAIVNNVDYGSAFVGYYNAGDVQYNGHASINNLNLVYWKETKNFADGCSSHIINSHFANGNLALPDQATFVIEGATFGDGVRLESAHHCNVGITGVLCMPQYILHDISWNNHDFERNWIWFQYFDAQGNGANQHYGGIFSLSPPIAEQAQAAAGQGQVSPSSAIFPPGFVSLVSGRFSYLLSLPGDICTSSDQLGASYGIRYDHGILCKVPLRALKIYSRDQTIGTAPRLLLEAWARSDDEHDMDEQSHRTPDAQQEILYHQIGFDGQTPKQGYSIPVIPEPQAYSYRLSVQGFDGSIPQDWIVEFSDVVMGRWGIEYLRITIQGRDCGPNSIISSQHDRRFLWSGDAFASDIAWGHHGACTGAPDMDIVDCSSRSGVDQSPFDDSPGELVATECPQLCMNSPCDSSNSYCHCGTGTCACKPGFSGPGCAFDVCASSNCGENSICSSRYLGDPFGSLDTSLYPCICAEGFCEGQGSQTGTFVSTPEVDQQPEETSTEAITVGNSSNQSPTEQPPEPVQLSATGSGTQQENWTPAWLIPATPVEEELKDLTPGHPTGALPVAVAEEPSSAGTEESPTPEASERPSATAASEEPPATEASEASTAHDCTGVCPGTYPFGCASEVPGTKSYRCHPNGGCYYAKTLSEPSPIDGFCIYNIDEKPPSISRNIPVDNCAGECPGEFPYGCATFVEGMRSYRCKQDGGCFYAASSKDPSPAEGFCTFLEIEDR